MSEEVGLSASLSVNADGVKTGAAQATSSLQSLQAEMVRTQAALGKETDTGNIDRLQQKIVGLGNAIQVVSKGSIKANDIIPSSVASSVQQQTNAINTATQTVGANVKGLSYSMNRAMHGVPELFYAPGRAINILATQIPNAIDKFRELSREQKALTAAGKPAASTTQLLTQAFDPLNLAIGLGVLVLVKYVPKLIEMAFAADQATDSLTVMSDALKDDKSYSAAIANVNKLTEDIYLAKTGFLDKSRVVKEYNDTIGKTTGQVKDLDEAENALIKNKDAYLNMMAQKAVAAYAYQKAAEATVESQIKLLDSKKFSVGDFFKGAFSGNQGGMGYINSVTNGIAGATQKAKDFNKIASDAEANAASIAKAFNFNLFGDDKTDKASKDKKVKHIKDVVDVLAEMNKAFADTDAQVEAHTTHIGDAAKKNLGEVTKAINDLIKMGIKPSDPIIQGLQTLRNNLDISATNDNIINVKHKDLKYLGVPKVDPKMKTGIMQYFDAIGKERDKAYKEGQKQLEEQNKLFQNAIGSSIIGLSEGIGTALATGDFSGIFDGFKTSLGNAIQDFGKYIIEQAIILKVLKDTVTKWIVANPALAIAAGAALVALGAAIKSSISSGGKSSPGSTTGNYTPSGSFSGGGGYSSPSGYSGASAASSGGSSVSGASANIANNIAASMGTIGISGDFKLNGTDLIASMQRTQKLQNR